MSQNCKISYNNGISLGDIALLSQLADSVVQQFGQGLYYRCVRFVLEVIAQIWEWCHCRIWKPVQFGNRCGAN